MPKRIVALGVAGGMSIGCALLNPTAESFIKVKGAISDSDAHRPSGCVLEVATAGNGAVIRSFDVEPEFEKGFTAAPGFHEYYFTVRCPGWAGIKSKPYELGGARNASIPLDLGTFQLQERK